MSIQVVFSGILLFLLVFIRLAAMILFNPFFSRTNVPMMARMGLVMAMAFLLAPLQSADAVSGMMDMQYVLAMFRELFIGLVYGFAFQIFYYMLYVAGDLMDTDFGFSMAKTFDPATNIQTAFSGSLVTILFAVYFFSSGAHLALLRMFGDSFAMIPVGGTHLAVSIPLFIVKLFIHVFMLALRLVAPFMVAEFILQASMGILMKFIPQITVFVINFQLRILLGILLLLALSPFIGRFIDNYISILFDNLADLNTIMAGG